MPRLTISSYAVLSLLAIRSWTGYELTQQAMRSLRFAWPKSERLLYSEPKKLVELGLAISRTEVVGGRSRKVYEITNQGRKELADWTATSPQPFQLEAEALLRVLFADYGSLENLMAALSKFQDDAAELEDQVITLMTGYLEGHHPFPQRTHLSVLFATFQLEFFDLVKRWVNFARNEVGTWPTTVNLGMTQRTKEILETITHGQSALDLKPQPKIDNLTRQSNNPDT